MSNVIDLENESENLLDPNTPVNDEKLQAKLEGVRLRADEEFEEPDYTLSQNGTGFAPRGNIMALMAEMKHGKTFVNTTFAAAVIRGEFLGLKAEIENARVLFFDTEQDKSDGQRIQRRVQYINGWDFKDDESHQEQFRIYHLRELPFDDRRELIDYAVRHYRPDVVFIDGIRDLLQDFNSLDESADLIQWMMTLSSECNCAIWTVLHVNPNSDKMRGHLGTELGNKVTDVMRVVKHKDKTTGEVYFEVEHVAARHRDIDGWKFRINDSKPYGIPELLTPEEAEEMDNNEFTQLDTLMKGLDFRANGKSWTELEKNLKEVGIGRNERQRNIKDAVRVGVLNKADNGRYYYQGGRAIAVQQNLKSDEDEAPF